MESLVLKKRKRCSRTFHSKRCKCEGQRQMLPEEMWLEILTRLPIKSLVISGTVCLSWKVLATNIRNNMSYLPQCGFFLGLLESYICLKASKATNLYAANAPGECIMSSGYDQGTLADLDFDFGELFKNAPWERNSIEGNLQSCTVSKGLVIFRSDDGELHVMNPATREAFIVPKSSRSEKTGWEDDYYLIIRGFETSGYSDLLIVRYVHQGLAVEYYSNGIGRWFQFLAVLDDDLRGSELISDSCVTVKINGRRMIFMLTNTDSGIVVKVPTNGTPAVATRLRLPKTVNEQGLNTRLGACGGCVYLSHLTAGCLSVWKHNYSEVDHTWVLLCKINISRRLKADDPVSNLGFHEDALIVYISTKSSIFSYCLPDDTLNLIVQLNVEDSQRFLPCDGEPIGVVPFTPFLGSLISPNINSF